MASDNIFCCIAGCNHVGWKADAAGRLYCKEHWNEAIDELCSSCPKCDVLGCMGEGFVTETKTGKHYCHKHAWRSNRSDEHGLNHPNKAEWNEADVIRAHSFGIRIEEC